MVKKMFYVLMAFLFICAFTITTTPVYAQEEEEEVVVEDVADISLEDLLNVEITTAGRRAERIADIPASVVVISRKDIETYGYQSLSEILRNIPGLSFTNDLFSDKFAVRGFWTERDNGNVIILVDDVPQPSEFYNAYPIENIPIPVEAIDRIEVVRGPMSVIYGAGAFFGVINIKTNVIEDEPVSMVSASGGSENTFGLFVRSSGKIEDFQYTFNGAYSGTDGMNQPYSTMISDPSLLPLLGVPEDKTTEGQLKETDKYFNFSGTFKGFSVNASYAEAEKDSIFLLPSVADGMQGTYRSARVAFGYKRDVSEKVSVATKFIYFNNRWEWVFDWFFDTLYALEDDSTRAYRIGADLFFTPSPKLNLTLGLDYHKVLSIQHGLDIPLFGLADFKGSLAKGETITTQAVYTQIDYKFSDQLKLVLGARVEQMLEYDLQQTQGDPVTGEFTSQETRTYSQTDPEFIPRAALIFSPNESNAIKLLYGKALTRPSFFQSEDLFGEGAEPLLPETIQTFEVNYIFSKPKFTAGLSVFYNLLDNLIYRTQLFIGGVYYTYHQNVGELRTVGAELTLTLRPAENFLLELSGTYQDTKDQRPGYEDIEPGYSPKLLGYLKASYFLNDDISIAVTGNYVDKMETFWDSTLENPDGTFGRRLGEQTESYFLLGANLRIRNMFGTGAYLNIRASNLLDQEIFYPTTSSNDWADKGTLGRGLSFLLTLGYKFIPQPQP